MKIDISRNITNRIYSTTLIRTIEDDPSYKNEKLLEEDFGPVQIDIGGVFAIAIVKEDNQISTYNLTEREATPLYFEGMDYVIHKFIKDTEIIDVTVNIEITHEIDAKTINELSLSISNAKISTDFIAEAECRIFEDTIRLRVARAINEWCKYKTSFETEDVDSIIINASCTGGE